MSGDRPIVQWVSDSGVRSTLLGSLSESGVETATLIDTVDASESAVYASLNDLERRDLIEQNEEEWVVTGRGQLVTDLLAQRSSIEEFLNGDPGYWQSHDVSVIPERFRLRLGELGSYEVIRRTRTDPRRVIREVAKRIEASEYAWILAPIYTDEYATALPDTPRSRLVLGRQVVEGALGETVRDPDADRPEHTEIRIGEAPIGLTVLPDAVLLSFPTLEGEYGTRSEILAESKSARQWAEAVFEFYWERATAVPEP